MLSLSCTNCHGTDGKSTTAIPKIAGLDKNYMYQTLLEYKTRKRVDTHMMQSIQKVSLMKSLSNYLTTFQKLNKQKDKR